MRSKLNLDFSSLLFLDRKQTKIKAKVYPELVVGKLPPTSAQMMIFLIK